MYSISDLKGGLPRISDTQKNLNNFYSVVLIGTINALFFLKKLIPGFTVFLCRFNPSITICRKLSWSFKVKYCAYICVSTTLHLHSEYYL